MERNRTQMQRMFILGQNATMTKQNPSLTTSPLIINSGKLEASLSSIFKH